MFKKTINLSLFLLASFIATTKNTYAMEADDRPSGQKTSDSHDFNPAELKGFMPDSSASHDFKAGEIKDFIKVDATDASKTTASSPAPSSSGSSTRRRKPMKPISDYAPKTRIAGTILEQEEDTPHLISRDDSSSESASSSGSSKGRSRSFTFSGQPIPQISRLEKLEKIEEQKSAKTKTTEQKRKEFRRSRSIPNLSEFLPLPPETEKWYFSKPKPGYTVCALKGEIEKIYQNIHNLYHNKKTKPLLKRLHTWVSFGFKKPNFFKEQPLPQDLKKHCIPMGLCDQDGYLTDATKYMIFNLVDGGKLINFEQLKHKNTIQQDKDRKSALIEKYKEESIENTLNDPLWEFKTPVYGNVYLRTTKKNITKTYKKIFNLTDEERVCLGCIINKQTPHTEKFIQIRDVLIKKKLIRQNNTVPLLVKYLHDIGLVILDIPSGKSKYRSINELWESIEINEEFAS